MIVRVVCELFLKRFSMNLNLLRTFSYLFVINLVFNSAAFATDEFWHSPFATSTTRVVDQVNARSLSITNSANNSVSSNYDHSASNNTAFELTQSFSIDSSLVAQYSEAEEQSNYMFGFTNKNLSVSYMNGEGEDYSEIGGSYSGVNPYQFHAGLKQQFKYSGYAIDYAIGRLGHMQFGQAKVSADGLLDRKASYVEWSNNHLFARATQFDLASDSIGNGFDAGFAIGANKQIAYQTMQLDNGASLNRIRFQLNGSYSKQYWVDLTSHRNPLYQDNNDQSIMFSFKTVLGAKKLVNYAAEPNVTATDEEGVETKKNNTALKRGVFIGVGVAAAVALSSSGDSDRDDAMRLRSQDEAAFDVLNRVNPLSVAENREYGGWVVLNRDGSYSPTDTVTGDNDSVSIPGSLIPAGTTPTASVHTHAAFDPRYDNENFSPTDLEGDRDLMLDGYLATPGGQFKYHNHETGAITTLGSIAN